MSKRLPIQFNDEQLELGSSRLADLYHKLTVELFEQMVDRLLERGTTSLTYNPYIWQLEKLNQMHALNEHNLKVISKYTDITEEQLRNVIEGEGLKIYTDTKSQLLEDLNKDPHFDTSHVQKQLEAYLEQASGDINNLINTTLPNVVNDVYRNIAKETVAKVATGVATPDKAIAETVMKWQEVGFRGFKDRGGKNWRIDNYARTVVKTTTRRVYRQMRTQPADELGIDTFYYSKKATAREACAPLQHHIVTYGEARVEGGYNVLSLADHGYGTPAGCLGINCGHYLTPFVIGINDMPDLGDDVKNITPDDAIKNANAQAKQRALERAIRDSKEKLHIANKLGDKELIDKYTNKIRTQQSAMRDFLKDKPFLHRDYAREKYHYNNDAGQKLYKSIDKRSKKEYSEILRNLGNRAPESYSDFKSLSQSEKNSLRYDNRIVNYFKGDIQEKLSDKQKRQAVEAYFNFKNDGIVFGDHAIARYIERMRRNGGTLAYNYDTVKTAFSLPPNYVSEQNGRVARYYDGILYITEPDTDVVVTMMKRKKLKGFKPL